MATDREAPDHCTFCIGTGIGWQGPDSHCWACNGSGEAGGTKPPRQDEDRPALNHFEPDSGEDETP